MNTPTEETIRAALELTQQKSKLETELKELQVKVAETQHHISLLDSKIRRALCLPSQEPKQTDSAPPVIPDEEAKPASNKAEAPEAPKVPEPVVVEPKAKTDATPKPPKAKSQPTNNEVKIGRPTGGNTIKELVLEALKDKTNGLTPEEVAEATGRNISRIYVWWSNIGKKMDNIVRIDRKFFLKELVG